MISANYLGTFPTPIIRPNQFGKSGGRFAQSVSRLGNASLCPTRWQLAPAVEYRSGFPYLVMDIYQNYVGIPNSQRFPNFLSLDTRASKDIQMTPKYAVRSLGERASISTNHFNPEAVHDNTADPLVGYFFGHRGRRFTVGVSIFLF